MKLISRCKLAGTCKAYDNYVKVNPNSVIIIQGSCYEGCTQLLDIKYNFKVYKSLELSPTDNQICWVNYQNDTEILGKVYS